MFRMAKTSLNHNYGFPLDRGVITPRPDGLNEEQYLLHALREGYALLAAAEKKTAPTPKPSVTQAQKLDDALAAKSTNPYTRARHTVLTQMTPSQRNIIERMERGELEKDKRYDLFCDQIATLGDKISNTNTPNNNN